MLLHANAKLGLAGRLALVRAIEDGLSLKAAAVAFKVSPATAHRWWHRWLRCHTGSTTTTGKDHTAPSATGHPSAAFTTSVGRTADMG
jgi:transposase